MVPHHAGTRGVGPGAAGPDPVVRSRGVGSRGGGRTHVARWTTMEDAVSDQLIESATPVGFGQIESALGRDVARQNDGAPARALTATVVAVGPRDRLNDVVE